MSIRVATNGRSPSGIEAPSASQRSVVSATRASSSNRTSYTWTRPASWLSLPDITGQQRFVGLHRIDPESNFVVITVIGAFTVDWGDGTVTNYASGTAASKQYDYSTIPDTGEATLGYRQVIIQVYPQSGQNITSFSLFATHPQSGLVASYCRGWLDINANLPNCTSFNITNSGLVSFPYLQQAQLTLSPSITSFASLFSGCSALQSVSILSSTASVTNTGSMFSSCGSLTEAPLFNTAAVTTMASMFTGCSNLTSVPLYNTSSVTSMSSMFSNCSNLTSVPLFNTSSVTNMSSMFSSCSSLVSVPLFNTAAVTTMTSMFSACTSLASVPCFNTSSVTSMNSMFSTCRALVSVPLFNTPLVTTMNSMFNNCFALASVPLFNTASVTDMSSMFGFCSSLSTVPLFNTASVTSMSSMFNSCISLTSVPLFNTSLVRNMSSMFSACTSLVSVPLFSTSLVSNMSSMFSSCSLLQSVPLFNTTSVTDMSSMFSGCASLSTIPLFDTSSLINISSMFTSCNALVSIPALNMSAARTWTTQPLTSLSSLCSSPLNGTKETISYSNCKLSSTALNAIYTNLADLTQGDASYSSVSLLMRFGGNNGSAAFTDLAGVTTGTISSVGSATISTSQSKWGGSSLGFPAGARILLTANTAFAFGTGNYTVEAWLYITNYNSNTTRIFGTAGSTPNFLFGVNSSGVLTIFDGSSTFTFGNPNDVALNQWHHIAFCRSGTSLRAYLNGAQVGSTQTSSTNMTNTLSVQFPATQDFSSGAGFLDDLRVTKGVARYTGTTLTSPSGPFPAYSTATKTITVTGNWGTVSDNTTIATSKGWTVTG